MDYSTALWIVMPSKADSIEFLALQSTGQNRPLLTLSKPGTPSAAWQENLPGLTAHFVRHRFEMTAPYVLVVNLSPFSPRVGDRYELRVRAVEGEPLTPAPGTISLVGDAKTWFSFQRVDGGTLIPDSLRSAFLRPGVYRLLSRSTDTFRVCKQPCVSPTTFNANSRTSVVVR